MLGLSAFFQGQECQLSVVMDKYRAQNMETISSQSKEICTVFRGRAWLHPFFGFCVGLKSHSDEALFITFWETSRWFRLRWRLTFRSNILTTRKARLSGWRSHPLLCNRLWGKEQRSPAHFSFTVESNVPQLYSFCITTVPSRYIFFCESTPPQCDL